MEFTGRIIKALEPRGGVSNRTGNAWKMQDFVIEETVGQYPKRMVFNVFGEDNLSRFNIQEGQELTISFDINAREYNGRWYNSVRAFDVRQVDPSQPAPSAPEAAPVSAPVDAPVSADGDVTDSPDNLPF